MAKVRRTLHLTIHSGPSTNFRLGLMATWKPLPPENILTSKKSTTLLERMFSIMLGKAIIVACLPMGRLVQESPTVWSVSEPTRVSFRSLSMKFSTGLIPTKEKIWNTKSMLQCFKFTMKRFKTWPFHQIKGSQEDSKSEKTNSWECMLMELKNISLQVSKKSNLSWKLEPSNVLS